MSLSQLGSNIKLCVKLSTVNFQSISGMTMQIAVIFLGML